MASSKNTFVALIILLASFSQALIQPFIYLEYQLRKDYIVKELCEQRYATINLCNGKCFIVKKLDAQQQKESEEKERNIRPLKVTLYLSSLTNTLKKKQILLSESSFHSFQHNYSFIYIEGVFHPPQSRLS